jgi:glycerol-3-phosphate acyltransferase PlsY
VISAIAFLVWVVLLAGIPFALVVTTLNGTDTDVRVAGSGNPGATNVARLFGWKMAAPVLAADLAKGLVPVILARLLWPAWDPWFGWAVAVTAFFSHCFSVYLEFRGGKGVATAAGGLLALTPFAALIAAAIWVVVLWAVGRSSIASLAAAVSIVGLVAWLDPGSLPVVCVLSGGIALTHLTNLRRLVRGQEKAVIRPVRWGRPTVERQPPGEGVLSQGPAGGAAPSLWKEREQDPLDPGSNGS